MSGFDVRLAGLADHSAIASGFGRACGGGGAPSRAAARTLRESPHGCVGVVASDPRGRVVGHFGVARIPMRIDGTDVVFGRVVASFVDAEYQVAGVHNLFHEMDAAFRDAIEGKEVAATYGVFAPSDWWTLRRLHGFFPVRTDLVLACLGSAASAPAEGVVVAPLGEVSASIADVPPWAPCISRRDAAILSFRADPVTGGSAFVAVRDGAPAGALVVRDRATGRDVVDMFAADAAAAAALLRAASAFDGPVRLPWFSRSPWFLLAQRLGYRVLPQDLPVLAVRPSRGQSEASFLREHWDASAGDVGLRPLPPMLATEEVVTSAPPGIVDPRERHV